MKNMRLSIYALAIAFARTNVPLSSARTWNLFLQPLIQDHKNLCSHFFTTVKTAKMAVILRTLSVTEMLAPNLRSKLYIVTSSLRRAA